MQQNFQVLVISANGEKTINVVADNANCAKVKAAGDGMPIRVYNSSGIVVWQRSKDDYDCMPRKRGRKQ